ncbi:fimbrial biogenesis chaperone [Acinetobacter silvestris]|uniref:Fimbrial chaperone protein n=1 Tax=Acinetobacter silvestris TaxID=1977882 RepID=A0A1Y3CG27_9GAMM|nr:molecular chaperone [Acinetobacter silvestris]OTG65075.1 fimbrial chaperone protein [Acinetobacter silvestris]
MRKIVLTLLTVCWINLTQAGVSIDGTRIIFPAGSTNVGVQVRNEFNTPALVQTWIDNGNIDEIPTAEEIPFVLTPPLSRVEPNQGQIIRIIQTGSSKLPEDRESLFWFNMLDIPPDNPNLVGQNLLSFTVRTRIKLFYRPSKLKISVNDAFNQIQFNYLADEKTVELKNPTPYYITFVSLNFKTSSGDGDYKKSIMVLPFSSQKIDFKLENKPNNVNYSFINDLGGVQSISKSMN